MRKIIQAGLAAYTRGDYETALKEFRPLAEQGDANAQYNLGLMYWHGKGVPRDDVRGHMWANLASANGLELSEKLRDIFAAEMTPADISKARTMASECLESGYKNLENSVT